MDYFMYELLAAQHPKAAVVDVDGDLWHAECGARFARYSSQLRIKEQTRVARIEDLRYWNGKPIECYSTNCKHGNTFELAPEGPWTS